MKITAPIFSLIAKGTIGRVLTFSHRRTGQLARFQRKPKDVLTAGRAEQRSRFITASDSCRFLEIGTAFYGLYSFGSDHAFYNRKALGKPITGYNVCIKEWLTNN